MVEYKLIIYYRGTGDIMRDDFTQATKDLLANRVGWKCSNPNCRKGTRGAAIEKEDIINIGVAAHITAASKGGPRYDESLTSHERKSYDNGIWLCQSCSKLIDGLLRMSVFIGYFDEVY